MGGHGNHDENQYILFSPEVVKLLHSNGLSTTDLLEKAGADGLNVVPDPETRPGQKDAMMILLGSAALVAASTPLITRVISLLVNKPVVLRTREFTETRDDNGLTKKKWTDSSTLAQGHVDPGTTAKVIGTLKGVEIGIGTG